MNNVYGNEILGFNLCYDCNNYIDHRYRSFNPGSCKKTGYMMNSCEIHNKKYCGSFIEKIAKFPGT